MSARSRKPSSLAAAPAAEVSAASRVAWWALLAIPVLVPAFVGKIPFVEGSSFALNIFTYPKIFMLALLLAVAWVAWGVDVFAGRTQVRPVPYWPWLAGLLGLGAVSTALASDRTMAVFGGQYNSVGMLALVLAGMVFVLAGQLVTGARRMRELTWVVVAGGVVVAAIALLQHVKFDPLFLPVSDQIGVSLLGNRDFVGTYLVVPTVLAAALALSESDRRWRYGAVACAGVTLVALVSSLARGGWLGVAVGIGVLAVAAWRSSVDRSRFTVPGVALAAAGLLAVFGGGLGRIVERFSELTSGATAGTGRLLLWSDALKVVGANPLLGVGADSYRLGWYAIRSAESVRFSGLGSVTEDPHNIPLLLAATIGVPAALLALGVFVAIVVRATPDAVKKDAPDSRLVFSGWWAATIAFGVALLFSPNTIVMSAMLALVLAVIAAAKAKPPRPANSLSGALVAVGGTLAVVAVVLYGLTMSADATLRRAQGASDATAIAVAAARTAPWHAGARYQAALAQVTDAIVAAQQGSPNAGDLQASAESAAQKLIDASPKEYANRALLALLLSNTGAATGSQDTLERAVVAADDAIKAYPISAEAAYLKAFALVALGRQTEAEKVLAPIWSVDPRYADAGALYAEVLASQGKRAEAERVIADLEQRFPGDPIVGAAAEKVRAGQGSEAK